jgi:hypothetical protein
MPKWSRNERRFQVSRIPLFTDPEYIRWKRKYPKFPGVAVCVELIGRRNVWGGRLEVVLRELQEHAREHGAELIDAFRAEKDAWVRCILLMILADQKVPEALPVFIEHLQSDDESLRHWAILGLRTLDTHDSRKALWEAGLKEPR